MMTLSEQPQTQDKTDLMSQVFGELIELAIQGGGPEAIIAFRPSEEAHRRLYALIDKKRDNTLTDGEKRELDLCMELEHLLRMAKIRARVALKERESVSSSPTSVSA